MQILENARWWELEWHIGIQKMVKSIKQKMDANIGRYKFSFGLVWKIQDDKNTQWYTNWIIDDKFNETLN